MPRRAAWTEVIVPKTVDLKKLTKQLSDYETLFFHGGLKFSRFDKFQFRPIWNQSPFISLAEETCNRGPALLAIIQRPMVDIHPNELIGQFPGHAAGVLQGVGHSLDAVVETELDAAGQNPGNN